MGRQYVRCYKIRADVVVDDESLKDPAVQCDFLGEDGLCDLLARKDNHTEFGLAYEVVRDRADSKSLRGEHHQDYEEPLPCVFKSKFK